MSKLDRGVRTGSEPVLTPLVSELGCHDFGLDRSEHPHPEAAGSTSRVEAVGAVPRCRCVGVANIVHLAPVNKLPSFGHCPKPSLNNRYAQHHAPSSINFFSDSWLPA